MFYLIYPENFTSIFVELQYVIVVLTFSLKLVSKVDKTGNLRLCLDAFAKHNTIGTVIRIRCCLFRTKYSTLFSSYICVGCTK
jgi:hypothetical protein